MALWKISASEFLGFNGFKGTKALSNSRSQVSVWFPFSGDTGTGNSSAGVSERRGIAFSNFPFFRASPCSGILVRQCQSSIKTRGHSRADASFLLKGLYWLVDMSQLIQEEWQGLFDSRWYLWPQVRLYWKGSDSPRQLNQNECLLLSFSLPMSLCRHLRTPVLSEARPNQRKGLCPSSRSITSTSTTNT